MYIWDVNSLVGELAKGSLTEKEAFKYLLANTILISAVLIPFPENNINDIIGSIANVVVAILGVIYIYKCNGGDKGKEIIQRYMSLGFVVAIRFFVMIGLPSIIILYIAMAYYAELPDQTSLFETVFYTSLGIVYFWKLGVYFKELNGRNIV
jgi:hypothetical protein